MNKRSAFLRVGLLLVVGTLGAMGLVLFLGRNRVTQGVNYETYFAESVQGLDVGGPVKYRGVTVGQVTEIGLVSAAYPETAPAGADGIAGRLVFARFVIDPKRVGSVASVEEAVKQGLRVRLASQGITGLAYLEADFVDAERFPGSPVPWKPKAPYIPSMPSTITQVQDAAQMFLARLKDVDIQSIAGNLGSVLAEVNKQLTSGDLHDTLAEAKATMALLRGGVQAADLPALAADLRATTAALRNVVDGKATKELLASAARATDRLSEAAAKLPALVTALQATTRNTQNGVTDIQSDLLPVLRDARAAAANLRDTSEALRRYPAGSLFGGPPPRGAAR
jgi:ABC-type transporter Mla subunit MlaD